MEVKAKKHLERGVLAPGKERVVVGREAQAGDILVRLVGPVHQVACARDVGPVLGAHHLRLGHRHRPHRCRPRVLACAPRESDARQALAQQYKFLPFQS